MNPTLTSPARPIWRAEMEALLAESIQARLGAYREGSVVVVQVTPYPTDNYGVDLLISVFPRYMIAPRDPQEKRDAAALRTFLKSLHDDDPYVRAGACEVLGQVGDPSVRAALDKALKDRDSYVRMVAAQALVALDAPRRVPADRFRFLPFLPETNQPVPMMAFADSWTDVNTLSNLSLTLWQKVGHLWKPLTSEKMNRHGQAWFRDVPSELTCRLQVLKPGLGRVEVAAEPEQPMALAAMPRASSAETTPEQLPMSTTLPVGAGEIRCTVFRDLQGRVMVEFRTDVTSLAGSWMHFRVKTRGEEVSKFVQLQRDPETDGIVSVAAALDDPPRLADGFEIAFDEPAFEPTAGE